jgi:hypothetical protein
MERRDRSGTEPAAARFAGGCTGDSIGTANAAEHNAAKRRNAHTADHGHCPQGDAARAGATTAPRQAGPTGPARTAPAPAAPAQTAPAQTVPAQTAAQIAAAREAAATRAFTQQVEKFNQTRENLLPKTGTTSSERTAADIENAPQGSNQQIGDLLVSQFPSVSQDSSSSGDYHVRNDHANVQFRINGIWLPDGVSGFAQFLETTFIGKIALVTGALPAQYGLHNTAVLDITTKDFTTNPNKGSVGVYGGSLGTIAPTFEYGGRTGNTEYFFTGREFQNFMGLENPTPNAQNPHDFTTRGGFFGYTTTFLDESTRLSTIFGANIVKYQIPTNPGSHLRRPRRRRGLQQD